MEETIDKMKVLIVYGNKEVDGTNKDGEIEKIYKDEDDTAHYFYMLEFLENHFKDEENLQKEENKRDVNTIFYEIQKLGHIVFAENTSMPNYKSGVMYMPKNTTQKQKESLKKVQKQLAKEDYNITEFLNLHRDEEGILLGNQRIGKASILDEVIKEEKDEIEEEK